MMLILLLLITKLCSIILLWQGIKDDIDTKLRFAEYLEPVGK